MLPLPGRDVSNDADPEAVRRWLVRARPPWHGRQGMPEVKPYVYRRGEDQRDAEIARIVAAAQARAAERFEAERRQLAELRAEAGDA